MHVDHKNMFVQFQVHKFKLLCIYIHFSSLKKNRSVIYFYPNSVSCLLILIWSILIKTRQTAPKKTNGETFQNLNTLSDHKCPCPPSHLNTASSDHQSTGARGHVIHLGLSIGYQFLTSGQLHLRSLLYCPCLKIRTKQYFDWLGPLRIVNQSGGKQRQC